MSYIYSIKSYLNIKEKYLVFYPYKLMSKTANLDTVLLNTVFTIFWTYISSAEWMSYG